jgi:hypothetical protein
MIAGVLLALPAVAPAQEAAPAAGAATTVNAVWVDHEIHFTYMGFTSYYSCDGLRDQVTWVLEQLGARPGFKVQERGCTRLTAAEIMPSVKIIAALPVAATPEVLSQLAADASTRELAARAKGGAVAAAEATAQFPARSRRVEFRSGRFGDLQDGECELMDQLRRQVFGPLGVKVIEDHTSCTPGQVTLSAVRMTVEVLEPVPGPPAAPAS